MAKRGPKPTGRAKTVTVFFRCRPELAEKLDRLADEEDLPRSTLIRAIVERHLRENLPAREIPRWAEGVAASLAAREASDASDGDGG